MSDEERTPVTVGELRRFLERHPELPDDANVYFFCDGDPFEVCDVTIGKEYAYPFLTLDDETFDPARVPCGEPRPLAVLSEERR